MKELSEHQIQVVESRVLLLVERAKSFIVENEEDVEVASDFLRTIKDTEKKIEDKRLEFTQPLNQSLRAINDTFNKLKKPLKQAREFLSDRVLSWRREEAEKIKKEEERRRKIQEAHEKAGHEVKKTIELEKVKSTIGNTRARKDWTFEIINFSELEDKFKIENTVMINQAIRSGVKSIKGLRIYQKETLTIV